MSIDISKAIEPPPLYVLDIVAPSDQLIANEFILDGLISTGVSVLAAYAGAGKSTAIVALSMRATGLIRDEFEPTLKRKVIIFTEHSGQIEEIIQAMIKGGAVTHSYSEVRKLITLVHAKRMSLYEIPSCAKAIGEGYDYDNERDGKIYSAKPWVIFDTSNANLDFENENDSQAVGKVYAQIKTEFFVKRNISTTISTHTSKALKHSEAKNLSARGSGAAEADAHQVIYLSVDGDTQSSSRYIEIGEPKHRFHAKADSIKLITHLQDVSAKDVFGDQVTYPVSYVDLETSTIDQRKTQRAEESAKAKDAAATANVNEFRREIIDTLTRWLTYNQSAPELNVPTRNAVLDEVSKIVGKRKDAVGVVFNELVNEGHIQNNQITPEIRGKLKSLGIEINNGIKNFYWLKNRNDHLLDLGTPGNTRGDL